MKTGSLEGLDDRDCLSPPTSRLPFFLSALFVGHLAAWNKDTFPTFLCGFCVASVAQLWLMRLLETPLKKVVSSSPISLACCLKIMDVMAGAVATFSAHASVRVVVPGRAPLPPWQNGD